MSILESDWRRIRETATRDARRDGPAGDGDVGDAVAVTAGSPASPRRFLRRVL
jgi:hypothetical protein